MSQLPSALGSPAEETEQTAAALQRIFATWAVDANIAFNASNFWPDAGTWTPTAGDVRLFRWSLVNRRMTVDFAIQNGASTGTVKILYLRVPNTGFKPVTVPTTQAQPTLNGLSLAATARCGLWRNTSVYLPGTVGVLNARPDMPVLACFLDDVSQINTVANAGCQGQITFPVQPA